MTETALFYAGIDWASRSHRVRLLDAHGADLGERDFPHSGEGLAAMMDWLITRSGAEVSAIHVAIETPHGPVVEALMERGFPVHAINPKQLDRFRDRYSMSGAKDDSRDSLVLASGLRTDAHAFRLLAPDDPSTVVLREWSRLLEQLGVEHGALVNRLRDQLWRYFPALLDAGLDVGSPVMLDLWQMAPKPKQAARLTEARLDRLLKLHRIRRIDGATLRDKLNRKPPAISEAAGQAAIDHIQMLIPRIRLTARQMREAQTKLDALIAEVSEPEEGAGKPKPRDAVILLSLPGVGRINLAAVLSEAASPISRRDVQALRSLTGVAPVTKRSGQGFAVVRRFACHKRLANAVYHWARTAVQHDPASRDKYATLRSRGHTHGRALRQVADRLLHVACKLLATGELYDPNFKTRKPA